MTSLSTFTAFLLTTLAVRAQSTPPVADAKESAPQWTAGSVAGLHLLLDDEKIYERMGFGAGGWVAISLGEKGGAVTTPAWHWSIVSGRLRIIMAGGDDTGKIYEELTLVSRDATTIIARRKNGQLATYRIQLP